MLRVDALATLYLVHPLRKRSKPSQRRVPILMYHSISRQPEVTHPYFRTVTSPEVFGEHLKYLSEAGYKTVRPSQIIDLWKASSIEASRLVSITFDDGFGNFRTQAAPLLAKHGFSATMYLPTAYIGDHSPKSFNGIECMTWNQVRELQNAGFEFGSHTVNHPRLKSLKPRAVEAEIRNSKDRIQQELGRTIDSFAYPYAFPETDRSFIQMLRRFLIEAGYHSGVSTIIGTSSQTDDP